MSDLSFWNWLVRGEAVPTSLSMRGSWVQIPYKPLGGERKFENVLVAELVQRLTVNQKITGSSPVRYAKVCDTSSNRSSS